MATLRASTRSRSSRPIRFALGADGFMAAEAAQKRRACTLGDRKRRVNDEGRFSDANYCLQSSGFSIGGARCVLQRRDLRCHFRLNVLFRDLADQRAGVAKNLIILILLGVAKSLKHTTALQIRESALDAIKLADGVQSLFKDFLPSRTCQTKRQHVIGRCLD